MNRTIATVVALVAVILLLGVSIIALLVFTFGRSMEEQLSAKIDPALYPQIVQSRLKLSSDYRHFPSEIDQKAIRSAFYHLPGFLQGGDIVSLRVQLPDEEIEKVLAKLRSTGRREVTSFDPISAPRCYPKFGMSKSDRKGHFYDLDELPSGFHVFLFGSNLQDIKENWNHNFLGFTAVSPTLGEVVYFAESW
jgi:hypothetical protein